MRTCKAVGSEDDPCPYERTTCCKYCQSQECSVRCPDCDNEYCLWED